MNKKGYLLSELIISFSLSFVILLLVFNTTITLNKKLSNLYVENKAVSQQIILNKKIGNDFSIKTVTKVEKVSDITNYKEYRISYNEGSTKILKIDSDNNYIEYNDEKINLPDNMTIDIMNSGITSEDISGIKLIKLIVPIKYTKIDREYGIELYNIADSSAQII